MPQPPTSSSYLYLPQPQGNIVLYPSVMPLSVLSCAAVLKLNSFVHTYKYHILYAEFIQNNPPIIL